MARYNLYIILRNNFPLPTLLSPCVVNPFTQTLYVGYTTPHSNNMSVCMRMAIISFVRTNSRPLQPVSDVSLWGDELQLLSIPHGSKTLFHTAVRITNGNHMVPTRNKIYTTGLAVFHSGNTTRSFGFYLVHTVCFINICYSFLFCVR